MQNPEAKPGVSVVIPTLGRESLRTSVESALAQTYAIEKVIVVVDGPLSLIDEGQLADDPRIEIISTQPNKGMNWSRATGIQHATTELIALLDDDDRWAPTKIEKQVAAYQSAKANGAEHVVVACRSIMETKDGTVVGSSPRYLLRQGQDVADYLFVRRQVRPGGAALGSSMLLFDRTLVDAVPFDVTLTRHTDWDWLVRVGQSKKATFTAVDEELIYYLLQTPSASASLARGWADSMQWITDRKDVLTRRQRADFMLCVTAPIALMYRDWRGAFGIMWSAAKLRSGSPHAWLFGFANLALTAKNGLAARRVEGETA
jgi:glycosyltransferase involved in cell wall biosynthesis